MSALTAFGGNNTAGSIEITPALLSQAGAKYDFESETMIVFDTTQVTSPANYSNPQPGDPCHPLAAQAHVPAIAVRTANTSANGHGVAVEVTHTLDGANGQCVAIPLDLRNALRDPEKFDAQNRQGLGVGDDGDPSATLTKAHVHGVAVAFPANLSGTQCASAEDIAPAMGAKNPTGVAYMETPWDTQEKRVHDVQKGLAPTLSSRSNGGGTVDGWFTSPSMQVRRLTPVECERLQGFPDGYTDIRPKGKPTADGPRYKALGNSWAVPVVRWIGHRIWLNTGAGLA